MTIYLFLDVNGVFLGPSDTDRFSPDSLLHFDTLVTYIRDRYKTPPQLVISSSWRQETLVDTVNLLLSYGFRHPQLVYGQTIRASSYLDKSTKIHLAIPRGVEIKQWLDTHVHSDNGKNRTIQQVGKDFGYLILDNRSDMLLEQGDHLVQTDPNLGFSAQSLGIAVGKLALQERCR